MLSIKATLFLNVFLLSANLFNAVPLNNNPETDSELFEGDIAGIVKAIDFSDSFIISSNIQIQNKKGQKYI